MRIGTYELLEEIGIGSTSVVYRAERDGARFALKLMKASTGNASEVDVALRFRREAAILARLRSDGLPRIHEIGEQDSQRYVVMELARGESLDRHIRRSAKLSESVTRLIGQKIASTLSEVHRMGLVHRDIKPQNILFDGGDEVKLIDFGFAEEIQQISLANGEAAGTFLYAPPEQTGMLKRPVDGRSDLYSLGAILYECITGRPVFDGSTVTELVQKHAVSPVPDIRQFRPDVHSSLVAIIGKLLCKDPDDRYQTAASLAYDLEKLYELPMDAATNGVLLDGRSRDIGATQEVRFIGRQRELEDLQAALAAARNGVSKVVQVEGEGGSGKSRLCQELLTRATDPGILVLRGKCQQAESVPLGVIREALDAFALRVLRLPEAENRAECERIRTAAGAMGAIVRRISRGLETILKDAPEVASLDAASERERSYWALAEFLARLSGEKDLVVLLIDDVQWIDASSAEVLRKLVGFFGQGRVLILTTARNDSASARASAALLSQVGDDHVSRIILDPLDHDDVAEFVSAFLGGSAVDDDVVNRLANVTNGNVFALGEYIRSMLDMGLLRPTLAGWRADTGKLMELTLSQNVIELITARLRALTDSTARILSFVAVYGREFDGTFLSRISGDGNLASRALAEALRANLVDRISARKYAFVHDRIREALVERLDSLELKDIHQRLAQTLDDMAELNNQDYFSLARHYVGGHSDRNMDKVYGACLTAGLMALDANSNAQALELLVEAEKARTAVGTGPSGRKYNVRNGIELDEGIGQALVRLGRPKEAYEYFDRCLRMASNSLERARLLFHKSAAYLAAADMQQAMNSIEDAMRCLGRRVPKSGPIVQVQIQFLRAFAWMIRNTGIFRGSATRSSRPARQLLSRMISPASQISYFVNRSDLNSLFILREFINAHLLGTPLEIARASVYYAFYLRSTRNHPLIHRFGSLGVNLSEQTGEWSVHAFCRHQYATSAIFGGDDVEGERLARLAIPYVKKYLGFREASVTTANLLSSLAWRGCSREVIHLVRQEQDVVSKTPSSVHRAIMNAVAYSQAMLMGDAKGAADFKKIWLAVPQAALDQPICKSACIGHELLASLDSRDFGQQTEKLIEDLHATRSPNVYSWVAYLVECHIRLQQFLRAAPDDRSRCVGILEAAVRSLGAFGKLNAFQSHVRIFKAAIAFERGRRRRAWKLLDKAHVLAERCDSHWGFFEEARLRAWFCRWGNDHSGARAYAHIAADIAGRQGWANRVRRVESEFGLKLAGTAEGSDDRATRDRGALRAAIYGEALLRVSTASTSTIDADQQARATLDELIKVLNAERAFLFLAPGSDGRKLGMKAGRDASGNDVAELTGYSSTVVKRVHDTRSPLVVSGTDEGEVLGSQSAVSHNLRSIIAAPVALNDRYFGVVYLDSRMAKGLFSEGDLEILSALASQIGVALHAAEMARLELQRVEMEKDLALTAAVQSFFLPDSSTFESQGVRLTGFYQPARQASGDWWWYTPKSGGSLSLLVGDVTGHGAAPAMLTAATASYLRLLGKVDPDLPMSDVLKEFNEDFRKMSKDQYSITMTALELDGAHQKACLWFAGSYPVFLQRGDGTVKRLHQRGSPLGERTFRLGRLDIDLIPGDRFLVFTDGLPDLMLPNGTRLRSKGLVQLLARTHGKEIEQAKELMIEEINRERMPGPLEDDITFVLVDIESGKGPATIHMPR